MRFILICVCLLFVSGCAGLSGTSLRCGTDEDSTFVELVNLPQNLNSNQVRYYTDLCGFAYPKNSTQEMRLISPQVRQGDDSRLSSSRNLEVL